MDEQQQDAQNDYGQEMMNGGMEEEDQDYDIGMYDQDKHEESQEESKEALKSKLPYSLNPVCRDCPQVVLGISHDRGRSTVCEGRPHSHSHWGIYSLFRRALFWRQERELCILERHACP